MTARMTSVDSSALTAEGTAAYRDQIEEAASSIRAHVDTMPSVAVLSDVEFDGVAEQTEIEGALSTTDIPHFPASDGEVLFGSHSGTRIAAMEQVCHLHEGHTPREVVFSVRMLVRAGVEIVLLPTAARSVSPQFGRGDLMLVTDHINFQGQNPLVGPNVEEWGPRFPDMTDPYDPRLRQMAGQAARDEGLSLNKGVFLGLLGPGPETTAEHRMARRLGADVVGSGLVPEVIAARHMGVQVLGITRIGQQQPTDGTEPVPSSRSRLHRVLAGILDRLGSHVTAT